MIGISYANIRAVHGRSDGRAGRRRPGKDVQAGQDALITEGPMAAWEQLKEMAADMRDAFIDAVKDFIQQKIIEQAITVVVSLFVPGAGIIKAIIGIYDTVVFFIQKAKTDL